MAVGSARSLPVWLVAHSSMESSVGQVAEVTGVSGPAQIAAYGEREPRLSIELMGSELGPGMMPSVESSVSAKSWQRPT